MNLHNRRTPSLGDLLLLSQRHGWLSSGAASCAVCSKLFKARQGGVHDEVVKMRDLDLGSSEARAAQPAKLQPAVEPACPQLASKAGRHRGCGSRTSPQPRQAQVDTSSIRVFEKLFSRNNSWMRTKYALPLNPQEIELNSYNPQLASLSRFVMI